MLHYTQARRTTAQTCVRLALLQSDKRYQLDIQVQFLYTLFAIKANKKNKEREVSKMAREPMVTRTFKTTKVVALCMDVVNCEPVNKEATLPRNYADEKKLMKATKAAIETNEIKVVQIVSAEEIETLYGMKEQDFINNATILPPRTEA